MQCKALFFTFLLLPFIVSAQNLVPNWSFEEYEECPDGSAQIERASGWMSFRLTPDYFNACDETEEVGVPNSSFVQGVPALNGNAYAGIGRNHNTGNSEVIGISLSETLIVDSIYYVSFFVNRILYSSSFGITDCWNDKIGAQFSTVTYQDWPEEVTMPINNEAQVYHNEMLEAHEEWIKIDGHFQADSAYNYIGIGYHFDEDSMNIDCIGDPFPVFTYFFLDCICVSKDPEMCPECEVISSNDKIISNSKGLAYPNPFNENVIIEVLNTKMRIKRIELFSSEGRRLLRRSCNQEKKVLINNLDHLKTGLYILMIEYENGTKDKVKLIKN